MRKFWTLAVLTAMLMSFFGTPASAAPEGFVVTVTRGCADNSATFTYDPLGVTGAEWALSNTSDGWASTGYANPTIGTIFVDAQHNFDMAVLYLSFSDGTTMFVANTGTCGSHAMAPDGPPTGGEDPDPVVVTPVAPTLVDPQVCGVAFTVAIPSVEGVVYEQDQFASIVTITASAVDGYVLVDGAETSWSFDVSPVECPSTDPTPTEPGKAGPTPTPGVEVTPTAPAVDETPTPDGSGGGGTVDDGGAVDDGTTGGDTGGTDSSGGDTGNTDGSTGNTTGTAVATAASSATTTTGSGADTTGNVNGLPTTGVVGPGSDDTLAWATLAAAVVLGGCAGGLQWHGRRA